jgi:signal transduction histidine kinase
MDEFDNYLILTQYRSDSKYNDFIGKYYHFPGHEKKSYLSQLKKLPIEFIYYEPEKKGKGEFFGYGKIVKPPFKDKREPGYYFIEIDEYRKFEKPISYKTYDGNVLEELKNPFYNPQNAVRKIPKDLLEEICLDSGLILNIESDAHLIKVLGEQLIGSEKVGILELIKNAFDAQASYCCVRIENIKSFDEIDKSNYKFPNYEGPIIIVEDDGIGMDKNVIQNGWLRPASTLKTNIKEQMKQERLKAAKSGNLGSYDALVLKLKKEHGGRIPLGEKGVGRFATHRLGRFLELRTKTKDYSYELVLKIDWNKFDIISNDFVNLNSIGISLFREKPKRTYSNNQSGTQLIIYGGKDGFDWDKNKILELNKSILSINSPYSKPKSNKSLEKKPFKAFLECPQIDDLPTTQIYEESKPNFSFDALINESGIVDIYDIKFKHPEDKLPEIAWSGKNEELRYSEDKNYWLDNNKKRKPACGAFYIHLDVWYRKSEWIDLPKYKELIEYLDEFGGIAVYRDEILEFDAKIGSEYDWLGLSKERIKQAFKLSYRDFIGNLELDQSANFDLIDKTNREGLIDNRAFRDLSCLARNAINKLLLPRYIGKRDELAKLTKGIISNPATLRSLAKTSSTFLSNVTDSNYPLENDPYSFFSNLWEKVEDRRAGLINLSDSMKELQKSIKMIENTQQLFVEQAGFGIAVAVSLHEINKITSNFYNGIAHLIKSGDFDKIQLENLKETSASLKSELKRLSPLRAIRNESRIEFNATKSIKYASEVYKRKLIKDKISFKVINPNEDFQIYGRYTTINQVFGNLLDNSIYWIYRENVQKREIRVLLNKQFRTIIFADTGSDISEIIRPYLFQPGYSLKEPPSGLGLYICKTYLSSIKARIYETPKKDRIQDLQGAQFTLDFNKTPAEKE